MFTTRVATSPMVQVRIAARVDRSCVRRALNDVTSNGTFRHYAPFPFHPDGQRMALVSFVGIVEHQDPALESKRTDEAWKKFHPWETEGRCDLALCIPLEDFVKPRIAEEVFDFMHKEICIDGEIHMFVETLQECPAQGGYYETQHVIIPFDLAAIAMMKSGPSAHAERWRTTFVLDPEGVSTGIERYVRVLRNEPGRGIHWLPNFTYAHQYRSRLDYVLERHEEAKEAHRREEERKASASGKGPATKTPAAPSTPDRPINNNSVTTASMVIRICMEFGLGSIEAFAQHLTAMEAALA